MEKKLGEERKGAYNVQVQPVCCSACVKTKSLGYICEEESCVVEPGLCLKRCSDSESIHLSVCKAHDHAVMVCALSGE